MKPFTYIKNYFNKEDRTSVKTLNTSEATKNPIENTSRPTKRSIENTPKATKGSMLDVLNQLYDYKTPRLEISSIPEKPEKVQEEPIDRNCISALFHGLYIKGKPKALPKVPDIIEYKRIRESKTFRHVGGEVIDMEPWNTVKIRRKAKVLSEQLRYFRNLGEAAAKFIYYRPKVDALLKEEAKKIHIHPIGGWSDLSSPLPKIQKPHFKPRFNILPILLNKGWQIEKSEKLSHLNFFGGIDRRRGKGRGEESIFDKLKSKKPSKSNKSSNAPKAPPEALVYQDDRPVWQKYVPMTLLPFNFKNMSRKVLAGRKKGVIYILTFIAIIILLQLIVRIGYSLYNRKNVRNARFNTHLNPNTANILGFKGGGAAKKKQRVNKKKKIKNQRTELRNKKRKLPDYSNSKRKKLTDEAGENLKKRKKVTKEELQNYSKYRKPLNIFYMIFGVLCISFIIFFFYNKYFIKKKKKERAQKASYFSNLIKLKFPYLKFF